MGKCLAFTLPRDGGKRTACPTITPVRPSRPRQFSIRLPRLLWIALATVAVGYWHFGVGKYDGLRGRPIHEPSFMMRTLLPYLAMLYT